jgi:thioredoxin reductase (NADPH)
MKNIYKCIILGSGPAGYSSAIYAARALLKPILYAGLIHGGQLIYSKKIFNYPGYPEGITGSELIEKLKKQALYYNTEIKKDYIIEVRFSKRGVHRLYSYNGEDIYSHGVIIATGSLPKLLGLKEETFYIGKGLSTCAYCDGLFLPGKIVTVIGGGNTAFEESIYLSKLCRTVHIIVRKNYLKATKSIQNIAKKYFNIKIIFNYQAKKILGTKIVQYIKLINLYTNKEIIITTQALFVAIGNHPNTTIFKGQIELDKYGYIKTKKNTYTNLPGIFAAGDVQDPIYRQVITSSSTGCIAALELEKYISLF